MINNFNDETIETLINMVLNQQKQIDYLIDKAEKMQVAINAINELVAYLKDITVEHENRLNKNDEKFQVLIEVNEENTDTLIKHYEYFHTLTENGYL